MYSCLLLPILWGQIVDLEAVTVQKLYLRGQPYPGEVQSYGPRSTNIAFSPKTIP